MPSITYSDGSVKESVLNLITVINPDETRLLSSLQRSRALQPNHSFLVQNIAAVDSTAGGVIEGAAFGADGTTDPTRLTNFTQIFRRTWGVSGTQKATAHFDKTTKARAMDEAMRVIGNDIEFALMRGVTAVAGSAGVARRLRGVKSWITTNATAGAGVAFTQTILDTALQGSYVQGGVVDSVYVDGNLKRKVDAFSTNVRNVNAEDNKLTSAVNIYESSFGIIKLYLHRYVTFTGDTNSDLVGVDTKRWGIAVLRDPTNTEIAITGDSETGAFIGELTLESRNEKSSIKLTNYI